MEYLTGMPVKSNDHRGTAQLTGKSANLTYQTLVSAVDTVKKTYCGYTLSLH